jgi:hypothetical protein
MQNNIIKITPNDILEIKKKKIKNREYELTHFIKKYKREPSITSENEIERSLAVVKFDKDYINNIDKKPDTIPEDVDEFDELSKKILLEKLIIRLLFSKKSREYILPYLDKKYFSKNTNNIVYVICSFENFKTNFPKAKDVNDKLDNDSSKEFISILKMNSDYISNDTILREVETYYLDTLIFVNLVSINELMLAKKYDEIDGDIINFVKTFSLKKLYK